MILSDSPRAVIRWWALPRRSICGHRIEWGCELETSDPGMPTADDLLVGFQIDCWAAGVSRWPCPWCGGETDLHRPPDGVMIQDRKNRIGGRIMYCQQIID